MSKPPARAKIIVYLTLVLLIAVLVGVIMGGIMYVLSVRREYNDKTRKSLLDKGNAAAAFIDSEDLSEPFDGNEKEIDEFKSHIKDRLNRLVASSGEAISAYILIDKGEHVEVMYASDGLYESFADTGDPRAEVIFAFHESFARNQPRIIGPDENPDGEILTTLSPITDPVTGRTVAVLGIDYPIRVYYEEVDKHTLHAVLMSSSVLVVLICLYWFVFQNQRLSSLTRESQTREKLFRTIFEQTPIGIGMMSNFNILSAVNQTYLQIFGRSEEELRQLSWADLTHPSDLEEDLIQFRRLQNGRD